MIQAQIEADSLVANFWCEALSREALFWSSIVETSLTSSLFVSFRLFLSNTDSHEMSLSVNRAIS